MSTNEVPAPERGAAEVPPAPEMPPPTSADAVHPLVRVGAEWTWRLLVLFAGLLTLGYVVQQLTPVVVPLALALLSAALLIPIVNRLVRFRVPRWLAVVATVVGSIGVLAGIMTFVVEQFISGLPQLSNQITASIEEIREWLTAGPLHLSGDQISRASDSVVRAIQSNQDALTSGALTTATFIGEALAGALLTLFILIFFLHNGRQIWEFVTRIVPTTNRPDVRRAGSAAFVTLSGYMRATVVVAAVDAIGIGSGLAILGVPLALPLASLVFIGAFIPIVGAFLTGFVAVFIAFVSKGPVTALITLGIIIAVMQLEGHVMQPLLLGRAVRVHPLGVVLAITTGIVLAGIPGGLLAVPLAAMANTAIRSLLGKADEAPPITLIPADDDVPDEQPVPAAIGDDRSPGR